MSVSLNWKRTVLAVLSFGIAAFGQDKTASINGPVLGFVQDRSHGSIQPILGVLGASVIGQPLVLGTEMRNAAISPKQDYALAVQADTGDVALIRFGLDAATMNSLGGIRAGADMIAISPTGAAAAVYGQTKIVQSIARLTESPEVVFEFDVSDIPGRLQSMAIADDGTLALLNFMTGEDATLLV